MFLSAETEAQLQDLDDNDARELLQSLGQNEPGLDTLIRLSYETLGYMSFFTSGEKESRAWTVQQGNGWAGAQSSGKVRLEGKDYVMQDGDICVFRHNS